MALLYHATLTPSKIELLQAWIPGQPWLGGTDATTVELVGSYRFDDPDGEVGIETHLLRTVHGRILQVPVTYRASAIEGAGSSLIGTAVHSVLGERWVYDACGDPVYVKALATAILRGGTEADVDFITDDGPKRWEATTHVAGSGSPSSAIQAVASVASVSVSNEGTTTVIRTDHLRLTVVRVVGSHQPNGVGSDVQNLTGTWPGQDAPALLALAQAT